MKRLIAILLAVFFLTSSTEAGEPKSQPPKNAQWTIIALSIQRVNSDSILSVFNGGTRVTCLLHLPDYHIVGVDATRIKLKVTDDKDTQLLAADADPRAVKEAKISKDGKYVSIALHGSAVPVKGAAKIRVQGEVAVMTANKEKEVEQKDVALGRTIDFNFATLRSAKSSAGRDNFLVFSGSLPLKKLVVTDDAGKEIPYRHVSQFEKTKKGDEFRTSLHASEANRIVLDKCTLRLTYFEVVERTIVPIDVATGISLQDTK